MFYIYIFFFKEKGFFHLTSSLSSQRFAKLHLLTELALSSINHRIDDTSYGENTAYDGTNACQETGERGSSFLIYNQHWRDVQIEKHTYIGYVMHAKMDRTRDEWKITISNSTERLMHMTTAYVPGKPSWPCLVMIPLSCSVTEYWLV